MLYLFLFLLVSISSTLDAMKITTKIDPIEITSELLLNKACATLNKKNPTFRIFNPAIDIRNLSFLSPHLKRYNHFTKKLKKYEKELTTLYLITMQSLESVATAQKITKNFLVDIKRLYIVCLQKYPENVEQKCNLIANFFAKPSINYVSLFNTIPTVFQKRLEGLLDSFLERYSLLKISTIITLDKTEESGYFVLLRFMEKENPIVYQTVYELQTMKQFCWDIQCTSIKEYYKKHQEFFKQELHILK